MNLKFISRDSFYICGYFIETSLETCSKDLSKLWNDYETKKYQLFDVFGYRNDFYGLMWYTENHNYCYLIGIEVDDINKTPIDATYKYVKGTDYAIAIVQENISAVDAWTEFFEKDLPNAGYVPNTDHGLNFEYYPNNNQGSYELWTPVIRKK